MKLAALLWIACACSAAAPPPPKSVQLNATGAMVNVEASAIEGYVTLVDYWAEYCTPCVEVARRIDAAIANEARVIVRKVDVGDGTTPVAKHYDIGALPHWRVFDRHRRLRYVLVGNDCLRAPQLAKELLAEP